jgi:hypothetical protein
VISQMTNSSASPILGPRSKDFRTPVRTRRQ